MENLYSFECKTAEEALSHFQFGVRNKVMASHKLNLASSRSHCLLTLRVESCDKNDPENVVSSKLELVDLAGSERTALSGAEGLNQKEGIEINKSLFVLRQVITSLSDFYMSNN